jgi:pyruvate/2-oxoglutarate dehydrogenase complex dihydrolipoamide acyltransferase (E2) component
MPFTVTLPTLGENVTEGTVTRWLKQPGDHVEANEPLLEVSTDKVDTEIPSPAAGTLSALLVNENDTVSIGGELAVITKAVDGPRLEPEGIPVHEVAAVTTPDPEAASATEEASPPPAALRAETTARKPSKSASAKAGTRPVAGTVAPLSRLRRVIAQRMMDSLATSAQLTTVQEVDLGRVSALRARVKDNFRQRYGIGLSYLPFFAKATVEALRAFPAFNATLTSDDQVIYHRAIHLAVAVDTPRGLLVPVIRDADELSVAGLAKAIADLATRTRDNTIRADELTGGTFTVTNIGSVGTLFDTPIINQPQVAILATGAIMRRPAVVSTPDGEESIAIKPMCFLPLTYDHRLIDGADAGRFAAAVRARLEKGDFEAELDL